MEREEVARGLSSIGERMACVRRDFGFTRRKMGEVARVDECVVRAWQEILSRPTLCQVKELAARCGTTPEWLMGRDLIERLLPEEIRHWYACQVDTPQAVLPLEGLDNIREFILWVFQQHHKERTRTGGPGLLGKFPPAGRLGRWRSVRVYPMPPRTGAQDEESG